MQGNDFEEDPEDSDDYEDPEDDETQDEDEEETESDAECQPEQHSEDEYGEYADLLDAIADWMTRTGSISQEQMQEHRRVVKEMLQEREAHDRKMRMLPEDAVSTWIREQRMMEKERALRNRLSSAVSGLDPATLGGLSDDWNHIIEDSFDEESRATRKDLKEKMASLSRSERALLIRSLYQNGSIDEHQFNRLMVEFG